jgi:multidrug efflux pump subunit AcrA (membrane-fusion protein)
MKKLSHWILWAALPALLLVAGCRGGAPAASSPADEDHDHEASAPLSVTLSPEAVAVADIRTEPAATRLLALRIAAAGEIEWNARRVVHLTARTPGRLERVLVVRGDRVREGQLLAELFSPDYLTLQAEYVQASARLKRHAGDPAEEGTARAFLAGARDRLRLLGVTDAEIEALGASSVPRPLLAVRAPLAGTVLEANVVAGDAAELGTSFFRLADPASLWACLHIQERDLAAVKTGAEVVLRTQAYPGEDYRGRLVLVGDVVERGTRTVEGRVEIGSGNGRLKPGMFVEATIASAGERPALVVPETAVQDDAGKPIVFVRTGERTFTRREVRTGARSGGAVEILEGLAEGEAVVTSGSFLLKSEIRKGSLEDEHGHA